MIWLLVGYVTTKSFVGIYVIDKVLSAEEEKRARFKTKQHSGGLEGKVPTTVQVSGEEGQGERLSCSWQEEMESLKRSVKQLTVKIDEQGEVIAGMKSCFRNVALSLLTFCKDNEEDVDGRHGNTANPEFYENEQVKYYNETDVKHSKVPSPFF